MRLRLALVDLGPIFVKFGQVLSTRRDLLPPDIADELAKLQDRVPPFPSEQVDRDARARRTAARSPRCSRASTASRSRARRSRRCTSPSFRRRTAARRRRSPSRCCGPAIEGVIENDLALMHTGGDARRAAVVGRQAPEAARGRRRVREDDPRRARPDARGGELLAAAPQLPALAAAADPRGALGLHRARSARDGAHGGDPDRPHRRAARRERRLQAARARRRRDLLHAGVPRRLLPRRHAPGQHLRRRRPAATTASTSRSTSASSARSPDVDKRYLARQLPRVLPPRLPPRRDRARRVGLGAAGHAHRRAGGRDPRRVRADLRPAAVADLARQGAAAAVPRVAPLQRRDPAAAHAAAEDAAERRGARAPARSGPRPVDDGDAVPRALDGGPDRPARAGAPVRGGSALPDRRAARAAAAHPPAG